jgi:hypothetical protein
MSGASASSSASSGIQNSGGNIVNNPSSNVPWIVAAALGLVGIIAWLFSRKGGK